MKQVRRVSLCAWVCVAVRDGAWVRVRARVRVCLSPNPVGGAEDEVGALGVFVCVGCVAVRDVGPPAKSNSCV